MFDLFKEHFNTSFLYMYSTLHVGTMVAYDFMPQNITSNKLMLCYL